MRGFSMLTLLTCLGIAIFALQVGSCNKVISQNGARPTPTINARAQSPADLRRWISPEVFGLKLGDSTLTDVKKQFGKPIFEGPNQEKVYTEDAEDEILVQYRNVKEADVQLGSMLLDFIVGKKTKVVKAVAIYTGTLLRREDILSKYGNDYFEIESWESFCIDKNRMPGPSVKKLNYPVVLVYPNKGMYVLLHEQNYVIHIGYAMKCMDNSVND
jgi:hypothetical protein